MGRTIKSNRSRFELSQPMMLRLYWQTTNNIAFTYWNLYSVMTRTEMLKVSLASKTLWEANGAQLTFLLSSMFAEETVKTAQVEMLLVAPVIWKNIVFENQVSACVVSHICYLSLLIGLGALLIEFEIGCESFWENSSQVVCLVSFRRHLDPFIYFLHALNVF